MKVSTNSTFQPKIIGSIPATEGVAFALQYLRNDYFSEVSGVHKSMLSHALVHATVNGKPCWFNAAHVESMQQALKTIGAQLITAKVIPGDVAREEQPLCYGADYLEKFGNLRKVLNLTTLFRKVMGWTEGKMKIHLSNKSKVQYYGKFSNEELEEVNRAITAVALMICSIELKWEDNESKDNEMLN